MKAQTHIVLGGAAAAGLYPVWGFSHSAAFWAASVLIDADHYLDFLRWNRFKDFSLRRMVAWSDIITGMIGRPDLLGFCVFHTVEFFLLVYFSSHWFRAPILYAVSMGLLFHVALDTLYLARKGNVFQRALSIPEFWVRWKILKKRGFDPAAPYRSALSILYDREAADIKPTPGRGGGILKGKA